MAFELGHRKWCVQFGDGNGIRTVEMPARETGRLLQELEKAKAKFGFAPGCRVRSCYEAGWDGFWLHRFLAKQGIENLVVDPASIEVNRRFRRAKTDRLDVGKLHALLLRHGRGERVWSVVVVPSVEDEDARQLSRELEQLRRERQRHRNRIQGLLVTQGVVVSVMSGFEKTLESLVVWDGSPLSKELRARLERELARLRQVEQQRRELKALRAARLKNPQTQTEQTAARLAQLRGIGETGSSILAAEFFGWRRFDNGKQVGSLAGLAPTPYSSGTREREQGINKAGSGEVRRLAVQLAWGWLRFQTESGLSRWFRERFAGGGSRMRRIGIVALARKLLVALWRYLEHGVIPDGAVMTPGRS
jgi:transposase